MTYPYNRQPVDLRIPERYGLTDEPERELRDRAWGLLERHGVSASWNGRLDTRIRLDGVDLYVPV